MTVSEGAAFAPCPTCRQYSHSIGEGKLAEAVRHFEMMYAHPVRGHPMGHVFEEKTRDLAQVLVAAALSNREAVEALRKWLRHDGLCGIVGGYGYCTCGLEQALADPAIRSLSKEG